MHRPRLGVSAAAVAIAAGAASATPLRLDYCIDFQGGMYRYQFRLELDNHDGSWRPGQGFGWIVFGDASQRASSIGDFIGNPNSFPVGPFTEYLSTSGSHNGPTLGPIDTTVPPYGPNLWVPSGVGDQLTWGGSAYELLLPGQLLWSDLYTASGAAPAAFERANLVPSCGGGPSGACCLPSAACLLWTQSNCTSAGGIYRGDGALCESVSCPQPPSGACCSVGGCSVITHAQCTAAGGTYHGDSSTCAAANCPANAACDGGFEAGAFPPCWSQFGDMGFTGVYQGALNGLRPHSGTYATYLGSLERGGIQQYINVSAGTLVTIDFWYAAQGESNTFSADLGSTNLISLTNDITHTSWVLLHFAVPAPTDNPMLSFTVTNRPAYTFLDDVFVSAVATACYANCDRSTDVPFLNVNDFICFQTRFAAADTYANCDGSTTPPLLNVNDFICFQTRFAAGCSAP